MLFTINGLTIVLTVLLVFIQGCLCFYPHGWREKRPAVLMMLVSLALSVAAFIEACSDRNFGPERDVSLRLVAIYLAAIYLLSFGQIVYMLMIRRKRRRERAKLHTDDPKLYKARKEFIEKVKEFNSITTVSRADIKVRGFDYVDYLQIHCGLANDDRYYLEYKAKAETRLDARMRLDRALDALAADYGDSLLRGSSQHSSDEYRSDARRSHITYSDPWDSHIDNNLPDSFDRDGDGYRDGSVGDSGLFDD